jgi:hypothetical protein
MDGRDRFEQRLEASLGQSASMGAAAASTDATLADCQSVSNVAPRLASGRNATGTERVLSAVLAEGAGGGETE